MTEVHSNTYHAIAGSLLGAVVFAMVFLTYYALFPDSVNSTVSVLSGEYEHELIERAVTIEKFRDADGEWL